MRFYNSNHKYHCGVDLHAKSMYLCILNSAGDVVLHPNFATNPEEFIRAIAPFRLLRLAASVCIPGIGWLTSANRRASSSCSVTRST